MKTVTLKTIVDIKSYFIQSPIVNRKGELTSARIPRAIAEQLLLENEHIVKDGSFYYFQIKNIGFGVHEIKLRPLDKVNTFIVNEWEAHEFTFTKHT